MQTVVLTREASRGLGDPPDLLLDAEFVDGSVGRWMAPAQDGVPFLEVEPKPFVRRCRTRSAVGSVGVRRSVRDGDAIRMPSGRLRWSLFAVRARFVARTFGAPT